MDSAQKLLSIFNLKDIDGHKIELSFSKTKAEGEDLKRKRTILESNEVKTTRLIVKNLPFQCNKQELKQLLDSIAKVQQVRIPKKKDNTSRGFG
mmetsp:Transcript_31252/g.68076  ORF Transcript_31252/g.68076 Transcript_31252/m.68076 type:complete len:94 (+) Transcript_31252:344-625(+)